MNNADRIIRRHGNIRGWENAMWREQERLENADREEAARVASRATLTSDVNAWQHSDPIIAIAPVTGEQEEITWA